MLNCSGSTNYDRHFSRSMISSLTFPSFVLSPASRGVPGLHHRKSKEQFSGEHAGRNLRSESQKLWLSSMVASKFKDYQRRLYKDPFRARGARLWSHT